MRILVVFQYKFGEFSFFICFYINLKLFQFVEHKETQGGNFHMLINGLEKQLGMSV